MKNQPEEIYLNLGDDVDCQDWNELAGSEIGWSTEPCTTDVLRYVRAEMRDNEELAKAFDAWFEREVKELDAFKDEEAGKKLLLTAWLNGAFCGGVL